MNTQKLIMIGIILNLAVLVGTNAYYSFSYSGTEILRDSQSGQLASLGLYNLNEDSSTAETLTEDPSPFNSRSLWKLPWNYIKRALWPIPDLANESLDDPVTRTVSNAVSIFRSTLLFLIVLEIFMLIRNKKAK